MQNATIWKVMRIYSFRINTIRSLNTLSILVEQFYKEENDKNKMMRSWECF